MTWDSARRRVVLFGGSRGAGPTAKLADTWEWDGSAWAQRFPPMSPPARHQHALSYDPARQRVVLFGGAGVWGTWEWDGTTWVERTPAVVPPPRAAASMGWDPVRGVTLLFGGGGYADTWEWDGSTWTRRLPVRSPWADAQGLAWDSSRQRLLAVGQAGTWLFLP